MLQKIIDNDEHWERAKEEVTQVVTQHSVTQTKLEEQEQLTFMEEQRARVSENICTYSTYSIQHETQYARKTSRYYCFSFYALQKEIENLRKNLTGQMTALEVLKV